MPRKVLTPVVPDQPEDGAVAVEVMLPVRPTRRDVCTTAQVGRAPNPDIRPWIPRITRLMGERYVNHSGRRAFAKVLGAIPGRNQWPECGAPMSGRSVGGGRFLTC